jgi:hypothetical protein
MGELVSSLVLVGVCGVIGVRLLLLARRTGALPELLIGSAFLLAGTVATGFTLLRAIAPVADGTRVALGNLSSLSMHAGVLCVAAFTWRVFRPADGPGRLVFGGLAAALLGSLASEIATQQPMPGVSGLQAVLELSPRAAVYLWTGAECARYWLRLRRQLRLGIGAPLVAAQMLCWVIGSLAIAVVWLRTIALSVFAPGSLEAVGSWFATVAVLVCAGAYWMAFFPPSRFRSWLSAA